MKLAVKTILLTSQYPIIPVLLGHPHCPFFEEEQPVTAKLTINVSNNVILNRFCIVLYYSS